MTLSHISEVLPAVIPQVPQTLDDLAATFDRDEALEYPDAVVPTRTLQLTREGYLSVPEQGQFAFNEWSKRQLCTMVGISSWSKWFASMSPDDQAAEINKRLWRETKSLRVRTARAPDLTNGAIGVVRALVSPTFSPLPDSRVARILKTALSSLDTEPRVVRYAATDKSVTYVMSVGQPFDPGSAEVGQIHGTLTAVNSGVGFRAASLWASLLRLVCLNGLALPVPDPVLFRRAHRGFDESKLVDVLVERLRNLPGKLRHGARVLVEARAVRIQDTGPVFTEILRAARLPLKFLAELQKAYAAEPGLEGSAFVVSQAVTRFAQQLEAEARFELERAAGQYLARLFPSIE